MIKKILSLLFLTGVFLRFYKLGEFVTFLGDQGRDAIVIKRILTFEHFPAIGPVTSIGNVYLGPFYYYFIAPWLLFFSFDPIGLAIGVAFFSSLYMLVNYLVVKKLFEQKTALISTALIVFSHILIDFSRFSWNPNLVPLFALLTVYFFITAFRESRWQYYILGGIFLAFSIQLHYLSLFLVPALLIFALVKLIKNKKNRTDIFKGIAQSFAFFILFVSPLVIFDLKHNFLNSKSFINQLTSVGNVASDKLSNLINTWAFIGKYALGVEQNLSALLTVIAVCVFSIVIVSKHKDRKADFFIFFLVTLLGVSLFGGPKYPHYFGIIYPLFYIALAYLLSTLSGRWGTFLIILFVLSFIFLNSQRYHFLREKGSYQIDKARKISKFIYDNITADRYTLTAIPEVYSDHTARYFLEVWKKKPQERENQRQTTELFVICEQPCKPIGNPLYDIARFAPTKVSGSWEVDDVTIYKLTR